LHFFKFINKHNVAYAEVHDLKLDFILGLQTILSLRVLC